MFSKIQVDMSKVKLETIKPWITTKITELMGGIEDDVLVEYVFNQLEADKVIILQSQLCSFILWETFATQAFHQSFSYFLNAICKYWAEIAVNYLE